ncbi:transglutaminase-like cysteine peptidase [Aquipseudomonas guryensis]|jgi:predicted transglutaminase-like cysteine proteinase|uniref:Transglutaminase-like cysteine peptidase n=1 Tax=Aquipseudomonas guryensis TaxID=2759165 RepID=A0A7W4H3W0_9GAMM|nr:transglutaminase-like cysteine peptidase [Pseudomonas guryensis]MBB1520043.1 transglutaminase-like cysteine peptidase [Pseudomonas guryensis]
MPEQLFRCAHALRRVLLCASSLLLCLGGNLSNADSAPTALGEALRDTRLSSWQNLLQQPGNQDELAMLETVNRFINRSVVHAEDTELWGEADYWATPLETLSRGRGDCEDFAIAKYFSLVRMGMPSAKMRLTFVKALQRQQAHMVLAYYPSPSAEPLILDNLQQQIRPASQRRDLLPVYAFNNHGIFLGSAPQRQSKQSPQLLSRWQDVSARTLVDGSPVQAPQG